MKQSLNFNLWLVYKTFTLSLFCFYAGVSYSNTGSDCPLMRSNNEVANTVMKAETKGLRLYSEYVRKFHRCFLTDGMEGSDMVTIVDSYALGDCKKASKDCVLIKYRPVARMSSNMLVRKLELNMNDQKSFELRISKKKDKWEIKGFKGQDPLITPKDMIEFLEKNLNAGPTNPDAAKAVKALREL
ncbi:hypothetical protein GW915_12685 [bacterium]|nr:hypothetical protein [bacterium]